MHPRVRRAAIKELQYSTHLLDLLGQDANARVVLHVEIHSGHQAPRPQST